MTFTVEWDGCGLIKNLSGHVSASEFARSAEATTSHPDFDRAKYVINDFTEVTDTELEDAVEHVAVMRIGASNISPKLKVTYVGNSETIKRFIAALLSTPFECGWKTQLFATRAEALRWSRQDQ